VLALIKHRNPQASNSTTTRSSRQPSRCRRRDRPSPWGSDLLPELHAAPLREALGPQTPHHGGAQAHGDLLQKPMPSRLGHARAAVPQHLWPGRPREPPPRQRDTTQGTQLTLSRTNMCSRNRVTKGSEPAASPSNLATSMLYSTRDSISSRCSRSPDSRTVVSMPTTRRYCLRFPCMASDARLGHLTGAGTGKLIDRWGFEHERYVPSLYSIIRSFERLVFPRWYVSKPFRLTPSLWQEPARWPCPVRGHEMSPHPRRCSGRRTPAPGPRGPYRTS
jgi:hypothetical protein